MTKHLSYFAGTIAVALVLFASSGFAPRPTEGVLSVLKPGMPVNLMDVGGGYEIGIFTKGPDTLGYKVIEVGADYVVVEDISGIKELRIPIYAIKSVSTTKLPIGK
jgi:hypothetical protein